jgi:hypothetical protein
LARERARLLAEQRFDVNEAHVDRFDVGEEAALQLDTLLQQLAALGVEDAVEAHTGVRRDYGDRRAHHRHGRRQREHYGNLIRLYGFVCHYMLRFFVLRVVLVRAVKLIDRSSGFSDHGSFVIADYPLDAETRDVPGTGREVEFPVLEQRPGRAAPVTAGTLATPLF